MKTTMLGRDGVAAVTDPTRKTRSGKMKADRSIE
jgi:hypothetical protein